MRPSQHLRSPTLLALLALATSVACNAVPEKGDLADEAVPNADVQLVVRGSSITPIFVSRSKTPREAGAPHAPSAQGSKLRWELLGNGGDVIDSGTAADPRVMRSEAIGGGNEMDEAEVHASAGVVRLTMSGGGGTLRLLEPNGKGWSEIGKADIAALPPDGERGQALVDLSTDLIGDVVPLIDHGDPKVRARILIVPEGYTEAELGKFHDDARGMAEKLATIGQFADYWDGFNLYMQDIRSRDSGVADPATGFNPTTAFEVTFGNDAPNPRRCTFYDGSVEAPVLAAVEALRQKIQADAVVVLANAEEYGGCASPANKLVIMTRNAAAPDVLAHELGHSLFGLGDEYGGSSCGYAPSSPNLAADLGALPWKHLLTTNELPTNPATAAADTVGAFDGAGYCDHGIYRPSNECMMRSLGQRFCPVCAGQVQAFFDARGLFGNGNGGAADPAKSTTLTLRNETGTGLFARCPREPGPGCSDWTWMWPGDAATLETSDPSMGFFIDNSTVGEVSVPFSWRLVTPSATDIAIFSNEKDPLSPQ